MLTSTVHARADVTVLRLSGQLNARTYQQARDSVVKAAIEESKSVIVDVNDLDVQDSDGWAVFTSARWCVQHWPDISIALVTGDAVIRRRLVALSVARYVPVYETPAAASNAIGNGSCRYRHRAREWFGPDPSSVRGALIFVREHLVAWSLRDKVSVASSVVTVLAVNALSHSSDGFDVRLEGTDHEVVIAVSDSSPALAVRRERPIDSCPAGLDIVAALCDRWGNTPLSTGKTVWARIVPKNTSSEKMTLRR